jgi:bifunctional non-homologous end joining protein LigD
MRIGNKSFEISNPDKVYFPNEGITKGEVLDYYRSISELMVPLIRSRPVSMLRFPDGINGERFYQKDAPLYFPSWIKKTRIKKEGGTVNQVLCNNAATLVYLANQGCLTPHVWLSKEDKINYPDRLIFDLDPSDDDFSKVQQSAEHFLDFLENDLSLNIQPINSEMLRLIFRFSILIIYILRLLRLK